MADDGREDGAEGSGDSWVARRWVRRQKALISVQEEVNDAGWEEPRQRRSRGSRTQEQSFRGWAVQW